MAGNQGQDLLGRLRDLVSKNHIEPYHAIDPTNNKLPEGTIVCIVGASRGIGKHFRLHCKLINANVDRMTGAGIARAYAKAGASGLVLASRGTSGLETTAKECQELSSNLKCEIVACDITEASSVAALASKVKSTFGRLDITVVNSGYSGPVVLKLSDVDPETFKQAIDVNYVGTFHCAKYLIPLLLASPNGLKNFIATSSAAALIVSGPIANAQYCVSKAAQLKLMEHVHEEYHGEGLRSYAVHPGAVKTEMANTAPQEFLAYLVDHPDLCGCFCTWLSRGGEDRMWLCGRLLSAKWDVEELEGKRKVVVEGNLLKPTLSL